VGLVGDLVSVARSRKFHCSASNGPERGEKHRRPLTWIRSESDHFIALHLQPAQCPLPVHSCEDADAVLAVAAAAR
jgi:hypothetical protein